MVNCVAVVTTVGREPGLQRMLASLPVDVQLYVAWQGQSAPSLSLMRCLKRRKAVLVRSSGGASRGRNDAWRSTQDISPDTLVVFPNDDTFYVPGFFEDLSECSADVIFFDVLQGGNRSGGTRPGLRSFPNARGSLARRVLIGGHEPGMALRAGIFQSLGGFDESIGVGSAGEFQSGEGADLLARLIASHASVASFSHAAYEMGRESGEAARAKRLKYASGVAFVLGRHRWMAGSRRALLRHSIATSIRARDIQWIGTCLRAYRMGAENAGCYLPDDQFL